MKKSNFILAKVLLMTIIVSMSCNSAEKKEENAKEEVVEAKEDLKEATAEVARVANEEEWKEFKTNSELMIANNEKAIVAIKIKLQKPGKTMDNVYIKRIDSLEKRNLSLTNRISYYDTNKTDWEAFKTEFNHDMSELGNSIKDLGVDNKK